MFHKSVQWAKATVQWIPGEGYLGALGVDLFEVFGIFAVISDLNDRLSHFINRPSLATFVLACSRPPFPLQTYLGSTVALAGQSIVSGLGKLAWIVITAVGNEYGANRARKT